MNEYDYLAACDLTRARMVRTILREMMDDELPPDLSDRMQQARLVLYDVELYYAKKCSDRNGEA